MKLKLYQHIGKYEAKEITKLDNDLKIELEYNQPINSSMILILNNGESTKKRAIEKQFEIDKEFIRVGVLKAKIQVILNGIQIEEFKCEDLIVKNDEERFEFIPEIESLRSKCEEQIAIVDKLTNKVDKLTKLVGALYKTDIKEIL